MHHQRMRLTELDGTFILFMGAGRHTEVDGIEEANGVRFLCPHCWKKNAGPVGTHTVICWFRGRDVPADEHPLPGRWKATGTSLADLTLHASVHLKGADCGWHGFIRKGDAT